MRQGTPIPRRENELRATWSGPVITYYMSPEEIAAKYGPPVPSGKKKRTINETLPHLEARQKKEEKSMTQAAENTVPQVPDKVEFLRLIAAGKSIRWIERSWGMGEGTLSYWVRKWNLKGIKPTLAQQLLDEIRLDGQLPADKPAGEAAAAQEPDSPATAEEVAQELKDRELVERLRAELAEKTARIAELESEVNYWMGQAEGHGHEADRLREERDVLLQTIERAAEKSAQITYLDAIEAVTSKLTGSCAYLVGAVIEGIWAFADRGDIKAIKRARWCINQMIKEVEPSEQPSGQAPQPAG